MRRREIKRVLLEELGDWISGETLAESLGVSRAAVWKQVQSLRAEGYDIEASKRGYRLGSVPDLLSEDLVGWGLKTRFVGRTIFIFPSLTSTNAEAKSIAASAEEGTVIVSEVQTSGRGRMERPWLSPPGGVWMSIILKPRIHPSLASRVNIAAAVAAARALESLYGLEVRIKWPNDLLVGEKKICGILTEMGAEMDQLEYAVVGIGINANLDPDLLPKEWGATSISGELDREVLRAQLIGRVLEEVERACEEVDGPFEGLLEEWSLRSGTLGRRVRITTRSGEFEGVAEALEDDGALVVRRDDGDMVRVFAGDCIHLRAGAEQANGVSVDSRRLGHGSGVGYL
ncbi:MAG TPA: biotin--[acetyl-CoA-carboxylase] ligase [Methanothrix sp.]|nr:biotin--[acetyl-CoA-carboxylase] ligase [Methanothrix sp.]